MSVDRFRFVSPGVFINEIDQSQVPQQTVVRTGPAIVGRTARGPAFVPTTVNSFDEFVQIFGNPIAGGGSGDVWRDGNRAAPTYAGFAAQAYLANNGPATIVRLLGEQSPVAGDDSNVSKPGWIYPEVVQDTKGGPYGLFIFSSGSTPTTPGSSAALTGSLAAVFYLSSSARIALVGARASEGADGAEIAGNAIVLNSLGGATDGELKIRISIGGALQVESSFNFDKTSSRYIRKVFNTNPQLVNDAITTTSSLEYYFLGETFDRTIRDRFSATQAKYGVILGLSGSLSGTRANMAAFQTTYKIPQTPPIIAQDPGPSGSFNINTSVREMFSVVARDEAEWAQSHLKIAFKDIKPSMSPSFEPYGSFTLQIRRMEDTDNNPIVLEEYNNLNINVNSPNYIARRIGDQYSSWDSTNKKFRYYGEYDNQSRYIRLDMNIDVAQGRAGKDWLPFGFKGVPKYKGFNIISGSANFLALSLTGNLAAGVATTNTNCVAAGSGSIMSSSFGATPIYIRSDGGPVVDMGPAALTASLQFPMLPLRLSSSDGGLSLDTDAYFGLQTTTTRTSLVPDKTIVDLVRMPPPSLNRLNPPATGPSERGPGFSLDNLVLNGAQDAAFHSGSGFGYIESSPGTHQGARRKGTSITAVSASYEAVLDLDYNRFVVPMAGGFDGFDIGEADPFNNTRALGGAGETRSVNNYAMLYTAQRGVDAVGDPDQVDINLLTVPGMTARTLTSHMLTVAEARADTLAIIDLEGGFLPAAENTDAFSSRAGNVSNTVTYIKQRAFNNSYGACYYPWVQVRDTLTGQRVWVPPSVAALGTYASSEAVSELWFAPAGFNRGGLSQGAAGMPVTNVVDRLTSKQRDQLYERNINPIASFPAEGIVVFGQKTLQATPSALDRINVRRLLIFLKKSISRISTRILFDPNIQVTWDRFLGQVEPLLMAVKNRYGLAEYRVILDDTTTTPELVDRNIMYAKVFLKPTRAIEFIALDFVITRTGASFDD